jgi:transitional endoplasmic reticulum ATPase
MSRGQCSWEDIRGYDEQLGKIKSMLYGPWKHQDLYTKFGILKSPGMLFYGPSGCGKSSVVQAIANDGTFSVIEVDLSELKSKYLGETEERLRHVFSIARQNAPCVLFLDEIDALGKRRGVSGGESGSGGAEERLLSTLLNEMDGIEDLGAVTIIGCSNRIDAIDSALKRPGRLDFHVHFDYPSKNDRGLLIESMVKKMNVDGAESDGIVQLVNLTESMSCAEIVQIFQEAGRLAINRSSSAACVTIRFQELLDVLS